MRVSYTYEKSPGQREISHLLKTVIHKIPGDGTITFRFKESNRYYYFIQFHAGESATSVQFESGYMGGLFWRQAELKTLFVCASKRCQDKLRREIASAWYCTKCRRSDTPVRHQHEWNVSLSEPNSLERLRGMLHKAYKIAKLATADELRHLTVDEKISRWKKP